MQDLTKLTEITESGYRIDAEARLKDLGIVLLPVPAPVSNYRPYITSGKLVFLSGQGPRKPEGGVYTGKVGQDVSPEEAYEHARLICTGLLAAVRQAAGGSLNNVKQAVKLLGMVNVGPGFYDTARVINGCSDLLVEVFGENGPHARSAIGMASLPQNMSVEIEAIFELY
ncbi:RidA family protein [Mesorhizobium shangrilense]|uniref:RidA family protein n=1 Tax=Mesorhizobium shangrilense TaxID=460060 RepID=A0ABV2DH29_9HYPH